MSRESRTCRIALGAVILDLVCPDDDFAASMRRYFGDRPANGETSVSLDLHLVPHAVNPTVPNSLLLDKQVDGARFDLARGLVHGEYDATTGHGELHVMTILTNGLMTRVFEQVLYQAFYSAARRIGYDAVLVHSAGVVVGGQGFLFVGPSEAGKSTTAELSAQHQVVNDEMNLVAFTPVGPRLLPSPFNGHFPDKVVAEAPLAAVLLLDKGDEHRLAPISAGLAAAQVAAQVAPPLALEDLPAPSTSADMLDLGSRLVTSVPTRRLVFRRDPGFWPVIQAAFPPDR